MSRVALLLAAVLLLASDVRSQWTDADIGKCRAAGRFYDADYGFEIRIPASLRGCPNSPVGMSNHGILIPLQPEQPRVIECWASYNALFLEDLDDYVDNELEGVADLAGRGSVKLRSRTRTTLGKLKAVRVIVEYTDKKTHIKMIRDATLALRAVLKDYDEPSHEYSVSLTTTAETYARDVRTLDEVLRSWRVRPTMDD